MLLHGLSCVSRVFSRFFGSIIHLFEDLEWFNCEKKHGKCSLCVRQSVYGACVCFVCHFCSCSQRYIHTRLNIIKHVKKNTFVCIFFRPYSNTHFPSVYLEHGEKSAVRFLKNIKCRHVALSLCSMQTCTGCIHAFCVSVCYCIADVREICVCMSVRCMFLS